MVSRPEKFVLEHKDAVAVLYTACVKDRPDLARDVFFYSLELVKDRSIRRECAPHGKLDGYSALWSSSSLPGRTTSHESSVLRRGPMRVTAIGQTI